MIAAGQGGLEPERGVAARKYVLFDAECGDEEAVNHILRGHDELDVLADGDVQLVDLALPFHVLDLPHPLFGDYVDFRSVGGRRAFLEVDDGTPDEEGQHHKERNDRPADFEDGRALDLVVFASGLTTILDRQHSDSGIDERGYDARDQQQIDVERIDLP